VILEHVFGPNYRSNPYFRWGWLEEFSMQTRSAFKETEEVEEVVVCQSDTLWDPLIGACVPIEVEEEVEEVV